MKNYKKGWQHLHDLKLTDQQEQYLLRQITALPQREKNRLRLCGGFHLWHCYL